MLTAERARELFEYDPKTGILKNRFKRNNNGADAGAVAGYQKANGYWEIGIDKKYYSVHRIIWLYMTGEMPKHHIDHIDMNPSNNKWENLREATRSQNGANRRAYKNNLSGFKGVSKIGNRWYAEIQKNGIRYNLGRFDSPEQAHAAYCKAASKLHGEYARAK